MNIAFRAIFSILTFASLLFFGFGFSRAIAAPVPLSGYAWSPNVGWIDMSTVSIDTQTGDFSGYAWSPNVGWLTFDPVNVPAGTGVAAQGAQLQGITSTGGQVIGFARFCTPATTGAAANQFCNGPTTSTGYGASGSPTNTEGWGGWVGMNGSWQQGVSASVNQTTGLVSFSGYAWGDEVVGWIDFKGVSAKIPLTTSLTCQDPQATNFGGPIPCVYAQSGGNVSFTSSNVDCKQGTAQLTWTTNNIASCTASGGYGFSGPIPASGGTMPVSGLPQNQSVTFGVTCVDMNGANLPPAQTVVNIGNCNQIPSGSPLSVNLSASQAICRAGASSVSWVLTNNTANTSCTSTSSGVGVSGFSVTPSVNPPTTGTDQVTIDPTGVSIFILSCTDPVNGSDSDSVSFTCSSPPPPPPPPPGVLNPSIIEG